MNERIIRVRETDLQGNKKHYYKIRGRSLGISAVYVIMQLTIFLCLIISFLERNLIAGLASISLLATLTAGNIYCASLTYNKRFDTLEDAKLFIKYGCKETKVEEHAVRL